MYAFIIALGIAAGIVLVVLGARNRKYSMVAAGIGLVLLTQAGFRFLDFWGEYLWFRSAGFADRLITELAAMAISSATGLAVGAAAAFLVTLMWKNSGGTARFTARVFGALWGAVWGWGNWEVILRWYNRMSTGIEDPILGRDVGFYLFTLPFLESVFSLLFWLSVVTLGILVFSRYFHIAGGTLEVDYHRMGDGGSETALHAGTSMVFLVMAFGMFLNRYQLLYSTLGAVTGPGWTDVHIRFPAYLALALWTVLAAAIILVPKARTLISRRLSQTTLPREFHPPVIAGSAAASIVVVWFAALVLIPGAFQWIRVEPNEITFETPYIAHNIDFTRKAFGLDRVEEREFDAAGNLERGMVENNPHIFNNIRLWDWRALDEVYAQFQEIRLYYEFVDVDIDRYTLDGNYRQVMVSARELNQDNLPAQSRTFVNKRFKYTHGYGVTLSMVNRFTEEGLPHLLVKDIPPKTDHPQLELEYPQIYYGSLARSHVLVNTSEEEFDYPSGEKNIYIHYPGTGGVPIDSMWRRFLFGWKFDGTRLFFSSYPTEGSRIMFHREIHDRVKTLAPFLTFDDDPYIVIDEGRLYWIVDAYTTSKYYPYSERFYSRSVAGLASSDRPASFDLLNETTGINYIRNAVKVVVDAFNGDVRFYVFDENDPIIGVWRKIYPEMFLDREDMPESLMAHVRYPVDLLLVQGQKFSKYHMTDPTVFYNQEDLWVRATEKYYGSVQPVDPYYVIWEEPGTDEPEFVLMQPFTPKNRQVLIGWIAGMCDFENYGRLLAYKFPKEKRVLGTQQMETKIDQDSFLSGQLSLWDQRGSNVIRGNVLVIPVENTLIYIEPIYLQADTAAYPELRLVAVMHNDNLSYAETFEEALAGLFGDGGPSAAAREDTPDDGAGGSRDELIRRAGAAFEAYLGALGDKKFDEAARALEDLERSLSGLGGLTGGE